MCVSVKACRSKKRPKTAGQVCHQEGGHEVESHTILMKIDCHHHHLVLNVEILFFDGKSKKEKVRRKKEKKKKNKKNDGMLFKKLSFGDFFGILRIFRNRNVDSHIKERVKERN